MSTFAFLMLCVQACLIQAVYSQCDYSSAPSANAAAAGRGAGWGAGWAGPAAYAPEAYHGHGAGNVAVEGDLGVSGATLAKGQVPVLGDVHFKGQVPASGAVTISGSCGCGYEY